MNTLTILLSSLSGLAVVIPSAVVFLNGRKLKALKAKKEEQNLKTQKVLLEANVLQDSYRPYENSIQQLETSRQRNLQLESNISQLERRISTVVTEQDFSTINEKIAILQAQLNESLKKEESLFRQAKPIMDRIEAENRRRAELERQARLKREEEERKARKKREQEEEEERQARRRRDEAAAASSYSSSSSWSSSSDSGSSWSGGGGDSSGGGSSDSW